MLLSDSNRWWAVNDGVELRFVLLVAAEQEMGVDAVVGMMMRTRDRAVADLGQPVVGALNAEPEDSL